MTSHQLRAIADLTRQHANGIADLTVRQNIQLHWVTIESLPEVLDGLWQVGLNTTGACGDVVRNVTGCPVAGVDAEEIVDASPLVLEAVQVVGGKRRVLQSAAQIQNLDHGMPLVVLLSRDQRRRPHCDHAPHWRKARSWILSARSWRPFNRALSRRPSERVRSLEPGPARRSKGLPSCFAILMFSANIASAPD